MLDTRFYFSSLFLFLSTERRSDAGIISLATIKSVPLMPSKRRATWKTLDRTQLVEGEGKKGKERIF